MSSLRKIDSSGVFSEASMIWLCAGTSMDESRNEELSHRYSVPPSRMRFRPWTKMLKPGS
jgi:hypothetical protein